MKDKAQNKHAGMIRGFYHLNEAWYSNACKDVGTSDEVMIGFYGENGDAGTSGEFAVRWSPLGKEIVPRLEVFDDAWGVLAQWKDLLDAMGEEDSKNIPPAAFCQMLIELGFKDLTPRVNPRS